MAAPKFTAIVFFHHSKGKTPLKYRGITNKAKFEAFADQLQGLYINYYNKETKQFDSRKWLKNWN